MRYTTPEWLLENLEKRVRLALGDRSSGPEQARTGAAKSGDVIIAPGASSGAVQSAA